MEMVAGIVGVGLGVWIIMLVQIFSSRIYRSVWKDILTFNYDDDWYDKPTSVLFYVLLIIPVITLLFFPEVYYR